MMIALSYGSALRSLSNKCELLFVGLSLMLIALNFVLGISVINVRKQI